MCSLRIIGAAALLMLRVARCSDDAHAQGKAVMEESERFNRSVIDAVALDGRALVAKWLNPISLQKRECVGTYKASCGDGYCCPATNLCCSVGYCKKAPGDDCCHDGFYCPAPTLCSGDVYSSCTASVKGTVTITKAGTSTTTAPPKTTAAPDVVYKYFYTTLYWSYYFYFYTYIYAIEKTTITSTYTTTTTTLSIYAANSATARSRLKSLSSSVEENDFTTPLEATTALNSTPASPTSSSASTTQGGGNGRNDGPVAPGTGLGPGDLPGAGTQSGVVSGWAVAWALGAGVVAWGMVWL
ncbi:hypothetical protein V492_01018 [Pseudogymnoascus sp. VKM F-4246]|nr:hypothetical protein V492_01018 [Pseudogymnoascus sp. VKM F-4246]